MTAWIMFDNDLSPAGVKRRLKEEMARRNIGSGNQAADRYGKHPQQWVSRRMTGQTDWKLGELQDFCEVLDLDYVYISVGIRTIHPDGGGGNVVALPVKSKPTDYDAAAELPGVFTILRPTG